jgi:hypothetical protein
VTGDVVTIAGLRHNKSINGEEGVLGAYDAATDRWDVTALGVRVRPRNLVKKQWLRAAQCNTTITWKGIVYTMHIGNDRSVRCLKALGAPRDTMVVRMATDDLWMCGYNYAQPELSDFDA